jgi:hypothetical protein
MENFYNGDGASTGGGVGAVGGAVLGTVISSVISGYFAKGEAEKGRALQKELELLSLEQQKELEKRLQDTKSETERQALAWQFLAVQNNNEMLNRIQSKRYTSYIVLGIGVSILALVFIKLARR